MIRMCVKCFLQIVGTFVFTKLATSRTVRNTLAALARRYAAQKAQDAMKASLCFGWQGGRGPCLCLIDAFLLYQVGVQALRRQTVEHEAIARAEHGLRHHRMPVVH